MNEAQNQADFSLAKAAASNVHQKALDAAQSAFDDQAEFIKAKHAANYQRAKGNHDQRKHDLGDPHLAQATKDFDAAKKQPPDYRLALYELDRATRAADSAYHDEMNRLAQRFGIGAKQTYWRAE